MTSKRRYVVVGTGHRVQMYLDAMAGDHRDDAELVGLVEPNPGRLAVHLRMAVRSRSRHRPGCSPGHPDALERMLSETRADRVIITSPDFTHADLIVRALDAGVDVVVEKPLTINPESTRQIAEAVTRTGRQVVVTHNYRYSPRNSGTEGSDQERLDRHSVVGHLRMGARHGARRGLLPPLASGQGQLRRPADSQGIAPLRSGQLVAQRLSRAGVRPRRGEVLRRRKRRRTRDGPPAASGHPRRRTQSVGAWTCAATPRLKALYLDNESYDGYRRDQDVFGPGVTTEDNLAVIVDYAAGARHSATR